MVIKEFFEHARREQAFAAEPGAASEMRRSEDKSATRSAVPVQDISEGTGRGFAAPREVRGSGSVEGAYASPDLRGCCGVGCGCLPWVDRVESAATPTDGLFVRGFKVSESWNTSSSDASSGQSPPRRSDFRVWCLPSCSAIRWLTPLRGHQHRPVPIGSSSGCAVREGGQPSSDLAFRLRPSGV